MLRQDHIRNADAGGKGSGNKVDRYTTGPSAPAMPCKLDSRRVSKRNSES